MTVSLRYFLSEVKAKTKMVYHCLMLTRIQQHQRMSAKPYLLGLGLSLTLGQSQGQCKLFLFLLFQLFLVLLASSRYLMVYQHKS